MPDEKKYDDSDLDKFEAENKEMIARLMAREKAKQAAEDEKAAAEREARSRAEDEYAREGEYRARRSAQDRYEEAMAREDALERAARNGERRAYDGYRYARGRAADSFDENRDFARDFVRDQDDYAYRASHEARDRMRDRYEDERARAFDHMDDTRERLREDRDRLRRYANEDLEDIFGPVTDPKFQQHLVGAGMEMMMAINSLIRNSPAPDFVKDFVTDADRNKNAEFCRKNENCARRRPEPPREGPAGEERRSARSSDEPEPITITPRPKKDAKDKKGKE